MKNFSILILVYLSVLACQNKTDNALANKLLKKHSMGNEIKVFRFHSVAKSEYGPQSYDHAHPKPSTREAEFYLDQSERSYYAEVKRYNFPGTFFFWTKEFQKNQHSYRYDVNGVLYGKRVVQRDSGAYGRAIKQAEEMLSFKQIGQLYAAKDFAVLAMDPSQSSIELKVRANSDTLVLNFETETKQLLSTHNLSKNTKYFFKDYVREGPFYYASEIKFVDFDGFEETTHVAEVGKLDVLDSEKLVLPKDHGAIFEDLDLDIELEKLSANLFVISNVDYDRYVAFKIEKGSIMVLGAPGGAQVSNEIIELIETKFPNFPIEYVYITHPHSDHMRGLSAYAKKGVKILADPYTKSAIEAFTPFAKDLEHFVFHPIENETVLNGVKFYFPTNSHSKSQSFAYFIEEEVIYEGDFLEVPLDNTIPTYMSEVERQFVTFLKNENLQYNRIIGHHRNGNIQPEIVEAYYQNNLQEGP